MKRENLRIVIVGHVDHGKSTLVGRLLYDSGNISDAVYDKLKSVCELEGKDVEFAFLLDAFEEERNQGITIDTAQIFFRTKKRDYTIIDAPGHREFIKNMVTGAAQADAAILLIDAGEGIRQQSRSHLYLLNLLGIKQVAVVINKMDLIEKNEGKFNEIISSYKKFLSKIGVKAKAFIPVVSKDGDNIVNKSCSIHWYKGKTVVETLDTFKTRQGNDKLPLRFCVQDVYKFDERRIIAGRIESGTLSKGDEILFLPSNKKATVKTVERWAGAPPEKIHAGYCAGITLTEQIFVERGEICCHEETHPAVSDIFNANIFWMGKNPLKKDKKYLLKLVTQEAECFIHEINKVIDTSDLSFNEKKQQVDRYEAAEITVKLDRPLALDSYMQIAETGRFVLCDNGIVCGGGIIDLTHYPDRTGFYSHEIKSHNIFWSDAEVRDQDRKKLKGHESAVIWFTGLSGAGKSTIAIELEKRLFQMKVHTYILDGDNVRHGLNSDLGFTPEDRVENIRRIGEVAKLFASSGDIAITSFISPYKADRDRVRNIIPPGKFIEIYVDCPVEVCIQRDPKNLYKKAIAGEILEFTGISSPYEPPDKPELTVKTAELTVSECVDEIIDYLKKQRII